MHNQIATRQEQSLDTTHSILSESPVQIPTAGKIRPGIKVLTPTMAKNKTAKNIYDNGTAAGDSYADIERKIRKELNLEKSPMMPKNVPYFTVKRSDFSMPEIADAIMDQYGDTVPGAGRRLHRFPIVFPVDSWQAVLPHGLRTYTRNELVYWSEYDREGKRYCKTHGIVEMDEKSKRAKRQWGGRPIVLRSENQGLCDPESCKEYQEGKCNLSGSMIFYIPGVPGSGAIEIPMKSFYAMQEIRRQLELMMSIRGRISGTYDGKPLFYVTKREDEVSMIDPKTGKAKRVRQYLTVLEGNIDMSRLMIEHENSVADGDAAVNVLDGSSSQALPAPEESEEQDDIQEEEGYSLEELQSLVHQKVHALKIRFGNQFTPYANRVFGEDWPTDVNVLTKVYDELQGINDQNKDEFLKKVGAE